MTILQFTYLTLLVIYAISAVMAAWLLWDQEQQDKESCFRFSLPWTRESFGLGLFLVLCPVLNTFMAMCLSAQIGPEATGEDLR